MKVFLLNFTTKQVQGSGLEHAEKVEVHAFTRLGALVGLLNLVRGSSNRYVIHGHQVYLSGPGVFTMDQLADDAALWTALRAAEMRPRRTFLSTLLKRS